MNLNDAKGAVEFTEAMLGAARKNIERDGHLNPVAFLLANIHPQTGERFEEAQPVVIGGLPMDRKDELVEGLRDLCRATDASGLILITEAWSLKVSGGQDEQEAMKGYAGRLSEHPLRREIVHATMEHRKAGTAVWVAEIHRTPDGEFERLGEFERAAEEVTGRFAGLLPQEN
jgi:hypothetical protein